MTGRAKHVVAALVQAFEIDQIPLTGVKGFSQILSSVQTSFDTGYHLQSLSAAGASLSKQHEFLTSSGALDEEDSARTALAGWHLILQKYRFQPVTNRLAAMAVEDGALHTHSLAMQHQTTWWLEDDDIGDPGTEAAVCGERLNEVAQQVTLSQPQELPRELLHRGADPTQDLRIATRAEMHAAAAALGRALKFDAPPFEWVYDGYKPLLLPDVVALRRGAPVALATLVICVLRRLGLAVVPHFPHHGMESGVERCGGRFPGATLERPVCITVSQRGLPCAEEVDLAVLMGVGQLATAPAPPRVLLCGGTPEEPCVLDPSRPKGAWVLPETALPEGVQLAPSAQAVFRMWGEHAGTMVTACQRRGESDEVVRWLYQHAALHPDGCKLPGWDGASTTGAGGLPM